MGKKKTKKNKILSRERRLEKAKKWLEKYSGKHIIRSYKKVFHVDVLTALYDLQALGIEFDENIVKSLERSEEVRLEKLKEKKRKKKLEKELDEYPDSDYYYAYIAGYTANGVAYGITWAELGLEPFASQEEIDAAYKKRAQYLEKIQEEYEDEFNCEDLDF